MPWKAPPEGPKHDTLEKALTQCTLENSGGPTHDALAKALTHDNLAPCTMP